ncbi:uncharacterized protein JN550_004205 [Neoarthrinium moseri]|uniref:uncharacterized protein n=1 Tax=Neoarthrinium moseri TaxID=1658444 RepID=UPI001FDC5D2F|nr:uncharacterized protein JN550_004205 [Neoarthrinium moseri]KAI1872002.1 hypothetical protein JN550_004205 [Neoarthrinium moseri]
MAPHGTVLLTGGTGKVARFIAPLLHEASIPVRIATRSGSTLDPTKYQGVTFDWSDSSTWEPAFANISSPVSAVWIVIPDMSSPAHVAREFVDLARKKGVNRFVLLSASAIEIGGFGPGHLHQYLKELGEKENLEWAVIRPTWFQENFVEHENHVRSIKEDNKIYSATGPGRVPWVSCRDIAAVAFHALTANELLDRDLLVLGDKLYTSTDLASIFTQVLGREIVYQELSTDELAKRHESFGQPKEFAKFLGILDTGIKNGAEDRVNDVIFRVTGRKPISFFDFVEENKDTWM